MALSKIIQDSIADDAVTAAKIGSLPAGSVLQVVQVTAGSKVLTSSTTYVDTGLSATITPSSTSSKILVILNQTITPSTTASDSYAKVKLVRGATVIWSDERVNGQGLNDHSTPSCSVLDSPSSTSALTYKTQFASGNTSYTFEAQHADLRQSTVTLMEIAG